MFRLNPTTLDYEWLPSSVCFAEEEGNEDAGGSEEGNEGSEDDAGQGSEEGTQASGDGKNTLLTGQEEQPTEQPDWRATIEDDDLRKLAERYESATAMAKAVSDLRKETSTRIKPLGENATDEEIAAYRKQTGVPEKAEDYEFKPQEGKEFTETDKAFHAAMGKVMHEVHITQSQATALNEALNGFTKEIEDARERRLAEEAEKAIDGLKKEMGTDFDRNTEYARRAAKEFGDDAFIKWLDDSTVDGMTLNVHPMFVKAFAQIGRRSGEAGIDIGLSEADRATLDERITEKRREVQEALDRGDHKLAESLDKEERELWAQVSRNQNIGPGPGNVAVAR